MAKLRALAILIMLTMILPCGCTQKNGADSNAFSDSRQITVGATDDHVRLIGRTCFVDDTTWLAQSGSAIEFEAEGTRVMVSLAAGDAVENDVDHHPRFAILVDGEVVLDSIMDEHSRDIAVFENDSPRHAIIQVMQLSEADSGVVGVASISIESSASSPIIPAEQKNLSIEFIGDSITCGYDVEASDDDGLFSTSDENFMKTYAYLAAQELDADWSAICYSGHGLISGWSPDGVLNEDLLVPLLYDFVSKEYREPWSFTSHHYDIVVINLGCNDSNYVQSDKDHVDEFIAGYVDFLTHVRRLNPDSLIICTAGMSLGHDIYPYVEQAVEIFKESTQDDRVSCYPFDDIEDDAGYTSSHVHPNESVNRKCADLLVSVIREELGA